MFIHLCCTPFVGDTPALFLVVVSSSIPPLLPPPLPSCEIIIFFSPPPDAETKGGKRRRKEKPKGHHFPCPQKSFPWVPICGPNLFVERGERSVSEWGRRREKTNFRLSPFCNRGCQPSRERSESQFSMVVVALRKKVDLRGEISVSSCRGYTQNNGMCLKM